MATTVNRRDEAFNELRAAREDTLTLVADLDQARLDAVPEPGRWSIGEILDHLVRTDEEFLSEIRRLADKQRRGRTPFVYRSLREIGAPLGSLPLPLRWPIEGTLALWNAAIPPVLRRWAFGQRRLRAPAPQSLLPRPGRAAAKLAADLRASLEELESLENTAGIDLDAAVYYSPVAGYNSGRGLIRLLARHDRRHQEQIREVLDAPSAMAMTLKDRTQEGTID